MEALKDWSPVKKRILWLVMGVLAVIALAVLIGQGKGFLNLAGTAGVSCDSSQIDSNPKLGQVMAASGLFLRAKPDINAAQMAALPVCSTFELMGRSSDSQWLEVNSGSSKGWIFYLKDEYERFNANVNINDLPISTNTYQPPSSSGAAATGSGRLVVSISTNVADVSLSGLPANRGFYIILAPVGFPQKAVSFSSGTTNDSGGAQFRQQMPGAWADGSSLATEQLVMNVFLTQTDEQAATLTFNFSR